MMKKWWKI